MAAINPLRVLVMDLPTLTAAQALQQKARYFNAVRGCKTCGGHSRYVSGSFSTCNIACSVCEPETSHLTTLCNISSNLNKHNRTAKKTWNSRYCIPRVFGGMSTK
jgi:hypothetical protein